MMRVYQKSVREQNFVMFHNYTNLDRKIIKKIMQDDGFNKSAVATIPI